MRKYIFLIALLGLIFSCKNDKNKSSDKEVHFELTEIVLDSTNLKACEDAPCPDVKVEYNKLDESSDNSKRINKEIENELIEIFNLSEEEPLTNSVEGAVNDFIEEYFKFKEDFPTSNAEYEAQVEQKLMSRNDRTIVFETSYYIFTGGAHGYGGRNYLNFDSKTGKLLTHDDLIKDKAEFTAFVEEKFRQQYEIPDDADINSKGFFFDDGVFALPNNIAITDKEVVLLYNPYEAASYAQGQLRFVFPKETVSKWLNY